MKYQMLKVSWLEGNIHVGRQISCGEKVMVCSVTPPGVPPARRKWGSTWRRIAFRMSNSSVYKL